MTARVLAAVGPFPHYLERRMRTTDFLYDGLRLQLRCRSCSRQFGEAGYDWIGDVRVRPAEITRHLARIEREAQTAIGEELCDATGPVGEAAA